MEATQTQMFPMSKVETAEFFLEHFQADVESAEKSLGNARARLRAALELRDAAEANLLRARAEQDMEIPGEATEDDVEDAEVLAIEAGEDVDPITGEATSKAGAGDVCPACDGDGRIPDATGGGRHGTCPICGGAGHVSCRACIHDGGCNVRQDAGTGCGGAGFAASRPGDDEAKLEDNAA